MATKNTTLWEQFQNEKKINKKSLKIPKGNQNPYIEEEQTTQWPKKKYKRTNNDQQNMHKKLKRRPRFLIQ
jgi:hypothetical protein